MGITARVTGALLAAAAVASPALADAIQPLITSVGKPDGTGRSMVEVSFLNPGAVPLRLPPPERIAADLAVGGTRAAVTLELDGAASPVTIPPGGFIRARYSVTLPARGDMALLTLPGGAGFALALPAAAGAAVALAGPGSTAPAVVQESLNSPRADTGNAFLGNLSAYEPIYAVYGPGTSTDAKLQFGFKFQLFGSAGATGRKSLLDGLHFAYTQRLYWDLGAASSPFRNVDYNPELIYIVPAARVGGIAVGGQGGIAHESNGRDGTASRSVNIVYLQPSATIPLGDWKLSVGPRVWAYVGDLGDNPDIGHFRGNTGLFAEIGQDRGLRVSTTSRFNFASGKGAVDVLASYPINRFIKSLNLYLFGQVFTGYGENLLDYDVRQTRARAGIGIVR